MTPEHFQKLADAGLNVEQIGVVIGILNEAEAAMKAAEDARKSVARERVQRWRDKQKDDVTLQKRNGNATVRLTRVEDSSSKEEISRKKERKEGRSQATRLPADWIIPKEWHDEAVAAGLTSTQVFASSDRMLNWSLSDPKGKKLDWRATWRNWFQRDLPKPHSTASPHRRRNYADVAMDAFAGKTNGTEGIFGNNGDAQRLPARRIESRPDDGNLQSGIGRRVVQIDH